MRNVLCWIKHRWFYYDILDVQRVCLRCCKCERWYFDHIGIFADFVSAGYTKRSIVEAIVADANSR